MATSHSEKSLELKVGAFVLAGLAVLAALVVQFGRLGEGFKTYYGLTVRFPDASGLLKGSDVLLAGAKIGRVSGGPRLVQVGHGLGKKSGRRRPARDRRCPQNDSIRDGGHPRGVGWKRIASYIADQSGTGERFARARE